MSTALRFTTHYVGSKIETQYAAALEKLSYPNDTGVVMVSRKYTEHELNSVHEIYEAPSRHAIAYRKVKRLPGAIIPFKRIEKKPVKTKFDRSFSGEDDGSSASNSGEREDVIEDSQAAQLRSAVIRRSRRWELLKHQKKKAIASEKTDWKWFEPVEHGRKTAGEVALMGSVDALIREQSHLAETQRRLSVVIVKYADANLKKPKLK
ncbi:Cysteine protease [Phytophthora megakarya]|uniref:Cysteine protease n=1 Tax=Phytophthora megakarya TaxID=4795 RepID=A0A225WQW9_9STRA|nr:Cysteine protease [Phytophthora megakarya]